jgi:hypothetical protein
MTDVPQQDYEPGDSQTGERCRGQHGRDVYCAHDYNVDRFEAELENARRAASVPDSVLPFEW